MSQNHRWPAKEYDYREDGPSHRYLQESELHDLVKVCNHYDEKLELYSKNGDVENYKIVKDAIQQVLGQASKLSAVGKKQEENTKRQSKENEEYAILIAGDLEDDKKRSPKQMHDDMIRLEGEFVLLQDTIESYKRQVRMLENSLPNDVDKQQFY